MYGLILIEGIEFVELALFYYGVSRFKVSVLGHLSVKVFILD